MIPLPEPQQGVDLLQFRNTFVYQTPLLQQRVPFFADIFVFSYPIFLLTRYIYGIYTHNNHYKNQALLVFTSAISGFLINFIIHLIVDKQRPEIFIVNKSQLLLSHLPTAPFPSDHATVSAAIAATVLFLAYKSKNHILGGMGRFFAVASLIMGICRVGVAVHWPTDVLAGWSIGIILGYICVTKQYTFLKKHIYTFLIAFEEQCTLFLTTVFSKK